MKQSCKQRTPTKGGNITVQLTSFLTGLDLTKQVKLFFISNAAESKHNKLEVIHTVILSLKLLFSDVGNVMDLAW